MEEKRRRRRRREEEKKRMVFAIGEEDGRSGVGWWVLYKERFDKL